MPTPPSASLDAAGRVEDNGSILQQVLDEIQAEGKKKGRDKKFDNKIYGWRHYYDKPKWKDFEPDSELSAKLESAPKAPPRRFKNATPGDVLVPLIREAHARGCIPRLKINFSKEKDSAGRRWSQQEEDLIDHKFDEGTTVLEVCRWLAEAGFAQVRMHKYTIEAYRPDSVRDHENVLLAKGKNLIDGPKEFTDRDRVTDVMVSSESGVHGWVHSQNARKAVGRRVEHILPIAFVKTWKKAEKRGKNYLAKHAVSSSKLTYKVAPNTGATPYEDYGIADTVRVADEGKVERHAVRQIALTENEDGSLDINVAVGKKVYPHPVTRAHRERALFGKTNENTMVKRNTPETLLSDGEAPEAPSAPRTSVRNGTVEIGWDGVDEAGFAPVIDQAKVETHVGTEENFTADDSTLLTSFGDAGTMVANGLEYGVQYWAKNIAVDEGGDRSNVSEEVMFIVPKIGADDIGVGVIGPDQLADDVPIPTTDGLPPSAAPIPTLVPLPRSVIGSFTPLTNPDPQRYIWHVQQPDPGTGLEPAAPSLATRTDLDTSASMATLTRFSDGELFYTDEANNWYGRTFYVAVEAYDDDVDTATTLGPVTAWIPAQLNELGTADFAAESVTAAKLAAVIALITDIQTAESGPRLKLNSEGLTSLGSGPVGGEEIIAFIPTDATSQDIQLLANIIAKSLTVLGNMQIGGTTNSVLKGSTIKLDSSVSAPVVPPTVIVDYLKVSLGQDADPTFKRGLHYVNATWTVTNKALTSNVATLTIGTHQVAVGQTITVTGVDATFNGTFVVTAVSGTTVSYAKVASNVTSTASGGTVITSEHGHYFTAITQGWDGNQPEGSVIAEYDSSGNYINSYPIKDATADLTDIDGGITKIGTKWYALTYWKPDDEWWVYEYATPLSVSTNAPTDSWQYTHEPEGGRPAIGTDGTNILIARVNATNDIKVRTYTPSTGANTSTITSNFSAGGTEADVAGVMKLTADMGVNNYVVVPRSSGVFNETWWVLQDESGTAGNRRPNYEWNIADMQAVSGACYNGTNFMHLSETGGTSGRGQLATYTANWWTTENPKWWFSYTWYDDDGTAHETPQSGRASKTMTKRARVRLTTPAIPDFGDADDPNKVRLFVGRRSDSATTDPGRTLMWLQTSGTVTTYTLTIITWSGTNPPSTNNFPEATPARIEDAFGNLLLAGDGSTAAFVTGDYKEVAYSVTGGGVVIDGLWLKADGTGVSTTTFARLFAKIGYTYGGSGGTFNLPDRRGRVPIGAGTFAALGATEGKIEANRGVTHVHAITSAGGHTHGGTNNTNHSGFINADFPLTAGRNVISSIGGGSPAQSHGHTIPTDGSHDHSGSTGNSGADPISYGPASHWLIKT